MDTTNEDIRRLKSWMKANGLNNSQLARSMDTPYITVHTVVERRGCPTSQFVNRFIRRFGYDVAKEVFVAHLAPVAEEKVA